MMQAAEEFIAASLLHIPPTPENTTDTRLGLAGQSAPPRAGDIRCTLRTHFNTCAAMEMTKDLSLLWLIKSEHTLP
jgi:hypothetical protein